METESISSPSLFENAITTTCIYLESSVPKLISSLKLSSSPSDFNQVLSDFISQSAYLLQSDYKFQIEQLLSVHTLIYSSALSSLLPLYIPKSPLTPEIIQKCAYLGWSRLIDITLEQYLSNKIQQELERFSVYSYTLHPLKPICEELRSEILSWHYKPAEFVEYLERTMHLSLGNRLIAAMFDLVLDFPETKPALSDLSDCLSRIPELLPHLENSVKAQLKSRVVHCSKSTDGILLIYINLTKVMKILFPTMEILESISDAIKKELRKRSDTFKCIIKTIAEDGELYALLDIKQKSVKEQDEFSSDEDELGAFEWQPIPRNALRNVISALNKRSDIVSMLINIYGSQEQFMEEYRTHLSDKLVSNTQFEVDTEIKDLEMLKKRFGEANLHKCEVMIQDVLSSKRINSFIHEGVSPKDFLSLSSLDFLIISSYFWPIDDTDYKFTLPPKLQQSFNAYSNKYSIVKASRKLKFHEQLGSVTLTLEFSNGSRTWSGVSPLHAAIITLFDEDSGQKSSEELSTSLGISQHHLRKEIAFWETKGVILRSKQNEEIFYSTSKNLP